MADHKHGEMDISVQEQTFESFLNFVARGAIVSISALILIALVNG